MSIVEFLIKEFADDSIHKRILHTDFQADFANFLMIVPSVLVRIQLLRHTYRVHIRRRKLERSGFTRNSMTHHIIPKNISSSLQACPILLFVCPHTQAFLCIEPNCPQGFLRVSGLRNHRTLFAGQGYVFVLALEK